MRLRISAHNSRHNPAAMSPAGCMPHRDSAHRLPRLADASSPRRSSHRKKGPILMSHEASGTSSFLRPFWNRLAIPPWLLSLLVLAILAAARFYSAFGPPAGPHPVPASYSGHVDVAVSLPHAPGPARHRPAQTGNYAGRPGPLLPSRGGRRSLHFLDRDGPLRQ